MGLKFIIIDLSVITSFSINLTAINRALRRFFTRIDMFNGLKVEISVGATFRIIHMAFIHLCHAIFRAYIIPLKYFNKNNGND